MRRTGAYGLEMFDFDKFGPQEMSAARLELGHLGCSSDSMEEAANEVVDYLFNAFRMGATDEPACALVRVFKTTRLGELPEDLREVALGGMRGIASDEGMPCLTLLATRGVKPEWNSRSTSQGHRAIPLASTAVLARAPMIARLVEQLGLDPETVVEREPRRLVAMEPMAMKVFHVEEAMGSEFVPIQTGFVEPMGVESVLGFGGLLPGGDMYCVLMFSRVRIRGSVADMFGALGLGVKEVLEGYVGRQVFVGSR